MLLSTLKEQVRKRFEMSGKKTNYQAVLVGRPFEKLSPNQIAMIKENIPNVDSSPPYTVSAATAVCKVTEQIDGDSATVQTDLFVNTILEGAVLKGTKTVNEMIELEDDNWYIRSFVFVKSQKSEDTYQIYTPATKSNLALIRGRDGSVVFKSTKDGDQWEIKASYKDAKLYQWKNMATGEYLHWDMKKQQFALMKDSTCYFSFESPPYKTKSIPDSLKPLIQVEEFIQESIKVAIGACVEYRTIFTARVSLKMEGDTEWRLSAQYVSDNVSCLKAVLNPSYEVVPHSSWKPWYFVLAEKEQATFEVLTAIAVNHGLIMQLENKNPHFANPDHSSGWTLCEFVYAGEDTWYWKVKGMDHYLYCDASTGDLTVTSDVQFRSSFTLIQDARFGP
jgi:hypothetical protein